MSLLNQVPEFSEFVQIRVFYFPYTGNVWTTPSLDLSHPLLNRHST